MSNDSNYTTEVEKRPSSQFKVNLVVGVGMTEGLPVSVTVNVYVPAVVAGVVVPPPPPPARHQHADKQPPIAPSCENPQEHHECEHGSASSASQARALRRPGRDIAVVAAVVPTVTVAVPEVPVSETVELPLEQVGTCVAPAGLDVRAQLMEAVPVKPVPLG